MIMLDPLVKVIGIAQSRRVKHGPFYENINIHSKVQFGIKILSLEDSSWK
jgi:hypothetical protein